MNTAKGVVLEEVGERGGTTPQKVDSGHKPGCSASLNEINATISIN